MTEAGSLFKGHCVTHLPAIRLPDDGNRLSLVAISGNVRRPSRTSSLLTLMREAVVEATGAQFTQFDRVEAAPSIMSALTRNALTPEGLRYVRQLEAADIVLIGSPIYRAAYTGALKHLLDLVDYRALRGAIGAAAITGGTALHALAAEHAIRNLFGFFAMTGVATTVFALDVDFAGQELRSGDARQRIARAAREIAAIAGAVERERAPGLAAG